MLSLKYLSEVIRPSRTIVYECRNCGTTLDTEATTCPDCESDEVAMYELSD